MISVEKLDEQMSFIMNEAAYLRKTHKGASWAEIKANKLDAIWETLRKVRQAQQMSSISGERIG